MIVVVVGVVPPAVVGVVVAAEADQAGHELADQQRTAQTRTDEEEGVHCQAPFAGYFGGVARKLQLPGIISRFNPCYW